MKTMSSTLGINYDKRGDILSVCISPADNTVGRDFDSQAVVFVTRNSDIIRSILIYDFMYLYRKGMTAKYEELIGVDFARDVIPYIIN